MVYKKNPVVEFTAVNLLKTQNWKLSTASTQNEVSMRCEQVDRARERSSLCSQLIEIRRISMLTKIKEFLSLASQPQINQYKELHYFVGWLSDFSKSSPHYVRNPAQARGMLLIRKILVMSGRHSPVHEEHGTLPTSR